jgi:hypothetical protein
VRYSLPSGSIVPSGSTDTIVSGLPLGGDKPMHPFIIDAEGSMYVDVATATNSYFESVFGGHIFKRDLPRILRQLLS